MKKFNLMKGLVVTLMTLLTIGASAEGTVHSTSWLGDLAGWTVESDEDISSTWTLRDESKGIEVSNVEAAACEEWLISPSFDMSDNETYTVDLIVGRQDSENGELYIYYSEDYDGTNFLSASFTVVSVDILDTMTTVVDDWGDSYVGVQVEIPSSAATVSIGLKYTSTGFTRDEMGTPDDTSDDELTGKNRVRVKGFVLTTSGTYTSPTGFALPKEFLFSGFDGWFAIDSLEDGKYWKYTDTKSYIEISDSKVEQNDWLISPEFDCSSNKSKIVSVFPTWKDNKSSNLSLYYATDFNESDSSATWVLIAADIIPDAYTNGLGSSKGYYIENTLSISAANVRFALQYTSYDGDLSYDKQNSQRLYKFKVEEGDDIPTSLPSQEIKTLSICPNPASDILNISEQEASIAIYTLSGQMVKSEAITTGTVGISDLSSGMYLLTVSTEAETLTQRFIKQ